MQFTYTESGENYIDLLNEKLTNLRITKVLSMESEKALHFFNESLHAGNKEALLGYDIGIYRDEEENKLIQLHIIRDLIYQKNTAPFRIVIDRAGVFWADEVHPVIRDLLVFGTQTKVKDISCYVIDLSGDIPIVFNYKDSLQALPEIASAIKCARRWNVLSNDVLCKVRYTALDFLTENQVSKETMRLTARHYEEYKAQYAFERGQI